jgi:RimJ/RimL family protein N-acetyltransferase
MIDTARLHLRQPLASDWPAYRDYRQTARSTGHAMPLGEAWTHFAAFFGHWSLRGFGRFIATLRDTGRPIGHFGPFFPEGHPERELTWTLWDGNLEGKGFAHEAAMAVRDHAFGLLGWSSAVSYIDPANDRSQALAARLGAVRDPNAPNPYGDATQVWVHRPVLQAVRPSGGEMDARRTEDATKTSKGGA